jgi:hypothetical protein
VSAVGFGYDFLTEAAKKALRKVNGERGGSAKRDGKKLST